MTRIEFLSETGSTNADLKARLLAGEPLAEGFWLVARRQTAGRGREGRTWFDGAGNFMGSTLVRPGPGDPPAPSLALVAGLAVREAVVAYLPDASAAVLKWPNDLLVGGGKIAGMLLEGVEGAIVAGIGVNLATAPVIAGRATTSLQQAGEVPTPDAFAARLADCFASEVERWRQFGLDLLLRRWTAAAHPVGTALRVIAPGGGIMEGEFAGLDPGGALRLRLADGSARVIHAADVEL